MSEKSQKGKLKPSDTVDYNIKMAWHTISRMYNAQASEHDISAAMGYILLNIDSKHGVTSGSIAPSIGLSSGSLTRTLNNMEKKGLIERIKDNDDGRMVKIFLTPKGIEKKKATVKVVKGFNYKVFEAISEDKLKIFFEVIQSITNLTQNLKPNDLKDS